MDDSFAAEAPELEDVGELDSVAVCACASPTFGSPAGAAAGADCSGGTSAAQPSKMSSTWDRGFVLEDEAFGSRVTSVAAQSSALEPAIPATGTGAAESKTRGSNGSRLNRPLTCRDFKSPTGYVSTFSKSSFKRLQACGLCVRSIPEVCGWWLEASVGIEPTNAVLPSRA